MDERRYDFVESVEFVDEGTEGDVSELEDASERLELVGTDRASRVLSCAVANSIGCFCSYCCPCPWPAGLRLTIGSFTGPCPSSDSANSAHPPLSPISTTLSRILDNSSFLSLSPLLPSSNPSTNRLTLPFNSWIFSLRSSS